MSHDPATCSLCLDGWTFAPADERHPDRHKPPPVHRAPITRRRDMLTLTGPHKGGSLIVTDDRGRLWCNIPHASLQTDEQRAWAKKAGKLLARAPEMRTILEHVQTELSADDDGTRFADLLELIRKELALSEHVE